MRHHEATEVLKTALRQMDEHGNECPFYRGTVLSRHGSKWHTDPACSSLTGRDERLQRRVDCCRLCSLQIIPSDLVDRRGSSSVRTQVLKNDLGVENFPPCEVHAVNLFSSCLHCFRTVALTHSSTGQAFALRKGAAATRGF